MLDWDLNMSLSIALIFAKSIAKKLATCNRRPITSLRCPLKVLVGRP